MSALATDERLSESELCPDALLAAQEAALARDIARLMRRRQEFVEVPCPACAANDSTPAFEKDGCPFRRCHACDTLYMSPRPSPDVMAAYYGDSENYRIWAEHIFPASEHARRDKLCKPRLDHIASLMKRFGMRGGTLMEIGPGFGTFAALAHESGLCERVIAIEPTPEMAAACRSRGVTVLEQRVEDPLPAGVRADVLVAFEVIEHLFDPRAMLVRCHEIMNENGLLVVSCPNADGFDIRWLGAASLAVDIEHVNLFTITSLPLLLACVGFEVLEAITPGRLDVEFVHRAIASGAVPQPEDAFMRRVLVDEYERLGWLFQQFLAESRLSSHMVITARKASTRAAASRGGTACIQQ